MEAVGAGSREHSLAGTRFGAVGTTDPPVFEGSSRRFRLPTPGRRRAERHGWVGIPMSIAVVVLMLLSSSDLGSLHLPGPAFLADSSPSAPPAPFLPYVVSPSQFPLPDTLLVSPGNISDPQLTSSSFLNQTTFELTYLETPSNSTTASVMFTTGRYDPTLAICEVSPTNCSGTQVPHSPINWSAPRSLLQAYGAGGAALAIGSSGGTIAVAASWNGSTTLVSASDYGVNSVWTSLTPTAIPGGEPKLTVSGCTALLTTLTSHALKATTFTLPCGPAPAPPNLGGGLGGEQRPSGPNGPQPPPPYVTSVQPPQGVAGTPVTIYGQNFAPGATAAFGRTSAWTVSYVSATTLTAVTPPGSGTVNVTVTVAGQTSGLNMPGDQFGYNPGPQPAAVEVVYPAKALPNSFVNVSGANFASSSHVYFGGRPALQSDYLSATDMEAQVPWGVGQVDLQVTAPNGTSLVNPGDVFTFAVNASSLPQADAASPTLLPDSNAPGGSVEGIVATDAATNSTVFYKSLNGGGSYTSFLIGGYSTSTGSPIFSKLGSTSLFMSGGIPAQTASLSVGELVFALYTTQLGGRTVVETSASTDGGRTWNGPYPSASLTGTLADPALAAAPNGYVYATWLEEGNGSWQLDQAVFSEAGQLLYGPDRIPGTSSGTRALLAAPTLAVDGWARPIYVWEAINQTTNSPELRSTGAFISPENVASDLSAAFGQTASQPWDFTVQGTGQSDFVSQVEANISAVEASLPSGLACTIQYRTLDWLQPELSTNVLRPVVPGGNSYCGLIVQRPRTDIVNTTGPGSADTYLGVYDAWLAESVGYAKVLEPFWPGAPGNPDSNETPTYNPGSPVYAPDEAVNVTSQDYQVSVQPVTINPNVLWLHVAGIAFPETNNSKMIGPCGGKLGGWDYTKYYDTPGPVSENISVTQPNGTVLYRIATGPSWASPFLTGVSPGTEGTWSITFHWNYSESGEDVYCSVASGTWFPVNPIAGGLPTQYTVTLGGYFTTALETLPEHLIVHEVGHPAANGTASDYIAWNNSINATANTTVVGPGYSDTIPTPANGTPVLGANTQPFDIPDNHAYSAYVNVTSAPGGPNPLWPDQFNTALDGGVASMPETASTSCSFYEEADPIQVQWLGDRVSAVTTSSATLTWYSNTDALGWARFNATSDGVYTETASVTPNATNDWGWNASYAYQVVLNGLSPWNLYLVTIGVSSFFGCLEFDEATAWEVQTLSLVQPQELDLPYDSVTQEGGGARITWTVPSEFAAKASFVNGSITYCQWSGSCVVNTSVVVPLPSLSALAGGSQFTYYWVNDTFQVNLTGLTLNGEYSLTVLLNYTLNGNPFVAMSDPFHFIYQGDTSGDGLTDAEKLRGWNVTWQDDGQYSQELVRANPDLYATNGLTNDYVEKLYGLDPNTVDSAGSHMLDTWNLTFDLGPKGSTLTVPGGSNFEYWYEAGNSSSDYAWTGACQYYPGPGAPCSVGSIGSDWSNITSNDSAAWASRVLWSRTALETFVNLSGVRESDWLRGTLGNTSNDWTLTLWGKLSWGADPLATSTPEDGIPDGSRINPLYDEQLVVGNLWSNLTACPSPPGGGAYGWAALFYLNWSTATGPHELPAGGNYSTAALDDGSGTYGCGSGISNYRVPIPINGTSQNQSLQVRILLNLSSSPSQTRLKAQKFVPGSGTKVSIIYDTAAGRVRSFSYSGTNATLSFTLSVVPSGVKTNTLLWLPTDNSTLNNLPWGLKRYTGEQAFDLIVVNQTTSSTLTSDYVAYAQNASDHYQLTLNPGLNNILIPRGQFLYSVLGQAILLGKSTSWLNASALPPLLGSAENSTINYGSSNPLINLACYWQNRAINNTTGSVAPICMHNSTNGLTSETGTLLGAQEGIVEVGATAPSGIDAGGAPGNPSLENTSDEGAALQTVLTLNESSQVELDLLLAALLDNATGGTNGTFLGIAQNVPSLGLNPVVTRELANRTQNSSGLFGVPMGVAPPPPPPPPCNSLWCYASNLVSGIVSVGSTLFTFVWTAALSVAQFVNDHLPTWLKNFGASVLARTAGALIAVGQLLASALSLLLQGLELLLMGLLSPVINPIKSAISSTMSRISSAANQTESDVIQLGSVTESDAFAVAHSLDSLATVTFAIDVALAVGVTLLSGVTVDGDFLVGVLATLFFSFLFLAPVALITTFSAEGITYLQTHYPNGLPSNDWKAIAGVAGIVGSSSDFLMWIIAGATKAASISSYASLAIATTMDLIVLFMSILSWAASNPLIAILALAMAVLAFSIALVAQRSIGSALSPLGKLSIVLSSVGMGTAGADVIAAGGT